MAPTPTPPPPAVSKALIDYLARVYPEAGRCPYPSMPDREIWMAVGKAEIIKKLQSMHDNQIKDSPVTT